MQHIDRIRDSVYEPTQVNDNSLNDKGDTLHISSIINLFFLTTHYTQPNFSENGIEFSPRILEYNVVFLDQISTIILALS